MFKKLIILSSIVILSFFNFNYIRAEIATIIPLKKPTLTGKEIEKKISEAESSWRKPGENSSGPISCYDSADNRERKKRAIELAEKKGCSAHNIAASWTINQSFPSFALIGPRTIDELDTTLPCLDIELTKEEINWLNLS